MMKLKDAVKLAVKTDNLSMLNQCANQMRYQLGMDYENSVAFISRHTGLSADDIEDLFYNMDKAEERGEI